MDFTNFNWQAIADWFHLRFNDVDSALAGISKAVTKLENDIAVRARQAEQATGQAFAVEKAAAAKVVSLKATATAHNTAVTTQNARLDKIKEVFGL